MATVDVPSVEASRIGKTDVLVTYRVGPFQSGMVRIPKEAFTKASVITAVEADVKLKAEFVGMTFKVKG